MSFDEKPDYNQLRMLFRNLMSKKGYQYDWNYDWVIKKAGGKIEADSKPTNAIPPRDAVPKPVQYQLEK